MAKKYKRSLLALGPLRKSKTDKLYLIISIPMFFVKFNGYHGTYFYVMLVLCPFLKLSYNENLNIPLQEYSLNGIL